MTLPLAHSFCCPTCVFVECALLGFDSDCPDGGEVMSHCSCVCLGWSLAAISGDSSVVASIVSGGHAWTLLLVSLMIMMLSILACTCWHL